MGVLDSELGNNWCCSVTLGNNYSRKNPVKHVVNSEMPTCSIFVSTPKAFNRIRYSGQYLKHANHPLDFF